MLYDDELTLEEIENEFSSEKDRTRAKRRDAKKNKRRNMKINNALRILDSDIRARDVRNNERTNEMMREYAI